MCVEKLYEMLVDKLNRKIIRDVFINQDEECLEVQDMRKEVDRKCFGHKRRRFSRH